VTSQLVVCIPLSANVLTPCVPAIWPKLLDIGAKAPTTMTSRSATQTQTPLVTSQQRARVQLRIRSTPSLVIEFNTGRTATTRADPLVGRASPTKKATRKTSPYGCALYPEMEYITYFPSQV
jgi:hypothetical protein